MSSSRPKNIIIIPFRFYKGQIEVLLKTHITKSKAFISEINGQMGTQDPSPVFAGARIFLTEFLDMNYKLDEKNINWDSHEFRKWLGVLCSAAEVHETEKSIAYFIEDYALLSQYEGKTNRHFSFSWYTLKEIDEQINRFSPSLSIFIYYELGGIQEFLNECNVEKKIYGILNTEPTDSWENVYEACYQGYFQRPHERWISFKVGRSEFPDPVLETKVKGWIITGSNSAAYEKEPWMLKLFELIRRIVDRKGEQKLLGFCFGHQSIAMALGGHVERMKNLDNDVMLLYKNRIYLKEEFLGTSFVKNSLAFKRINVTRGIYLNQAHGDYVAERPKGATHFGYLF